MSWYVPSHDIIMTVQLYLCIYCIVNKSHRFCSEKPYFTKNRNFLERYFGSYRLFIFFKSLSKVYIGWDCAKYWLPFYDCSISRRCSFCFWKSVHEDGFQIKVQHLSILRIHFIRGYFCSYVHQHHFQLWREENIITYSSISWEDSFW